MKKAIPTAIGAALIAVVAATSSPSLAQDPASTGADDWALTRLRREGALVAAAPFDNGITLIARCMDNTFGLIFTGLPEVAEGVGSRPLTLVVGDGEERPYVWNVAAVNRGTALSRVPAVIARQLAKGGRLQIIIPAEQGGRRTRYIVPLPKSADGLAEVMTKCGKPLVDPRDEELIGNGEGLTGRFKWVRPPNGDVSSSGIASLQTGGTVTLSCTALPTGRVVDCEVEDEFPTAAGYGRVARLMAQNGRIGWADGAEEAHLPFPGGRIVFTTNFREGR